MSGTESAYLTGESVRPRSLAREAEIIKLTSGQAQLFDGWPLWYLFVGRINERSLKRDHPCVDGRDLTQRLTGEQREVAILCRGSAAAWERLLYWVYDVSQRAVRSPTCDGTTCSWTASRSASTPSFRPALQAPMKPLKSGWGLKGRLLNSG